MALNSCQTPFTTGIMRHLRLNVDFFTDLDFRMFKSSLDAEMKRLQRQGLGSKKRQAESLAMEEEELLWENGFLGDDTPKKLLDTMVFCNALYFALRSGSEHRQLRYKSSQIELVQNGDRPYLKYTEHISKNRPGGIKAKLLCIMQTQIIEIAALLDSTKNTHNLLPSYYFQVPAWCTCYFFS